MGQVCMKMATDRIRGLHKQNKAGDRETHNKNVPKSRILETRGPRLDFRSPVASHTSKCMARGPRPYRNLGIIFRSRKGRVGEYERSGGEGGDAP